ncbi:MAG: hypothetical protein Q4D26_05240 [Clostridia bacterium]|nr:hypothetical protein [Clostridia bacterium]
MKKKIAIMLVGLMCVSAAGCSFFGGNKSVDMDAINKEDIFTEISDDTVVDGSTAAEAFTKALSAVEESDNITITVSNNITMGTEGQEDYQNSLGESEIKLAKDGETQLGSVIIDNSYKYASESTTGKNSVTEEKSKITGYYSGDTLYFITNEGDKVKEEMGYEDFLGVVNTYSLSVYNDCISKAACVEEKNGKTYYIAYDPAKFETTMNTNMEASGQTLADGEAMHVKYANIAAKLDNEDNLIGYGFIIDAEYVNDTATTAYNYSIKTGFSNRNSTEVDAVTNTDDYMTADEYTQKMQNEAAGAEENQDGEAETAETNGVTEESTN